MSQESQYFQIVAWGAGYRLIHIPSGEHIQRYMCDFQTRTDAARCRDRIIAAAPDWKWATVTFVQEMPCALFDRVWAAIYCGPEVYFEAENL